MNHFRLLDLFCGAGGAAGGYSGSGFSEIVGVDIMPQPHYPYRFVRGDALEYLAEHGQEYDAIHASPPCQAYSVMRRLPWLRSRTYPILIQPTLELLEYVGKPYVLENVMGARYGSGSLTRYGLEMHGLRAGWLCGTMFGKPFYRHRLFATNWLWLAPEHSQHRRNRLPGHDPFHTADGQSILGAGNLGKGSGLLAHWQDGAQVGGVGIGHAKGWHWAAQVMDIDWMTRAEFTQAVPPVYTEWVGRQLMAMLRGGV